VCQKELASKYIDATTYFRKANFKVYHQQLEVRHEAIPMKWKESKNTQIEFLYFGFRSVNVFLCCHDN
jgi:hypothetical protein